MSKKNAKLKAKNAVSKMTLEEKATLLRYDSPAVERLDIPAYNWWNEGLHGVARAGTATMFPQAIGLAAMFYDEMIYKVGDAVSTEARAIYNYAAAHGDRDIYKGLTLWSPNINIFRDPRWGRGHETYGEDPYLTSALAIEFVDGIQGDNADYYKTAACAKHFAVHSGPESLRHEFDAQVSEKDLRETYLYSFEKLVKNGVLGVMGAYNRVNGEPSCASSMLMNILYNEWKFVGYFVSDCWAIKDFHMGHMVTSNAVESVALALNSGCNINCGNTYLHAIKAVDEGLLSEETISKSAEKAMEIRYMLGLGENTPFDDIPYTVIDCKEHNDLSLECAEKSMVLLKNNGILPLDKSKLNTIGVIGPNADNRVALSGNYCGTASRYTTFLNGIQDLFDGRVLYSQGSSLCREKVEGLALPYDRISEAITVAENSDVVILCVGLDTSLEGEEGDEGNEYAAGDKETLNLPECQNILIKNVLDVGKPTVIVLSSGSSVNIGTDYEDALIETWYPGSHGGKALAEILFGEVSPSGKLPITFYKSVDMLPSFTDYSMSNRTYKFINNDNVLYPFGYGLTYSNFEIKNVIVNNHEITCDVKNVGIFSCDNVIQVYIASSNENALKNPCLCGFKRIHLGIGQEQNFTINISDDSFTVVNDNGNRIDGGDKFAIHVGFSQPDELSQQLTGSKPIIIEYCR